MKREPNTFDLVLHYWQQFVKHQLSVTDNIHSYHWAASCRWRDTSWLRFIPELPRHTVRDNEFRWCLAAIAQFACGVNISTRCTNNSRPKRDECTKDFHIIDHVLHCPGCTGASMILRHNDINAAIARALRHYGISYAKEPTGLPVVRPTKEDIENDEGKKGPDGLLNTFRGTTAVELHVSHPRIFNTDSDGTNYDIVSTRRNRKKHKYKEFEDRYDIAVCVFSVSSYGVIGKETRQEIYDAWCPVADDDGKGLYFMMRKEFAFCAARSLGMAMNYAKVRSDK